MSTMYVLWQEVSHTLSHYKFDLHFKSTNTSMLRFFWNRIELFLLFLKILCCTLHLVCIFTSYKFLTSNICPWIGLITPSVTLPNIKIVSYDGYKSRVKSKKLRFPTKLCRFCSSLYHNFLIYKWRQPL